MNPSVPSSAPLARPTVIAMAAALLCCAPAAWAQVAAADAPKADAEPVGLERVIVTAQKRPQFAEQVPMSLSAIGQEQLSKQGVRDIQDLSRLSPGLSATPSTTPFGTPNIAIRGIASNAGAATTAVYVDDAAVQTRNLSVLTGGTAYPQVFDLDRVEVLRGPQGTLFGSSAEGGAIRFITPTPRFDKFSGEARAGIATTQGGDMSYQAGVAAGGPINSSVAFRASLWHKEDGGYMDHVNRSTGALADKNTNKAEATVGRLSLLIKPTAELTIAPSIYLQSTKEADRNIYYEDAGHFNTYNKLRQPTKDRFSLSALSVSYETDSLTFKSVTSYYDRKQDRLDDLSYVIPASVTGDPLSMTGGPVEVLPGFPDYVLRSTQATKQRNATQEFRVSSNETADAKVSWVAGVYVSRAHQTMSQRIIGSLDPITLTAFGAPAIFIFGMPNAGPNGEYPYTEDDTLKDRSKAVFGEVNIKLQPKTTLTLGLRVGRNEFEFRTIESGPFAGGDIGFGGTQKGKSNLPKLALSHELSAASLLYASAAKGDRVGGANPSYAAVPQCGPSLAALGVADVPRTYEPDSLWSYEVGYKSRLLDKRMEVAASLYYVDWNNIQTSSILPSCLFGFTANAGNARSVGGDLQLQLRATRELLLSATLAYTDAKYTETVYGNGSTVGTGVTLSQKGQPLPIPGVNVTLGAEYSWATGNGWRAHVRGDYQYGGSFKRTGPVGSLDYRPSLYEAPATHYVSLHSGLRMGAVDLSLYVNNLFNSRTTLLRTADTPALQAATFRPRTVGFNAAYKF
jgi:iron complex outermembrane recepter protein